MSRTPAAFTQADVARAIRAARQAGADHVSIPVNGVTFVIRFSSTTASPPPSEVTWGSVEDFEAGYVYFAECGELIKIGFSRDIASRRRGLATSAPGEIRFIHVERGTYRTEKDLHRRFAAARAHGEWFRKTPELMAFLEQRRAAE